MGRKIWRPVLSVFLGLVLLLGATGSALAVLPMAGDDSATTSEDTPVNINVLANDSDSDGDTLSVTSVTDPANGTAAIEADYTITYTPDADFNGSDSFDYTVDDGNSGTDTATVTITVAMEVEIDIKPGSDSNPINLGSKGRTPVAILTTGDFDAATVDAATVRFGPGLAEPLHSALEDVDDDGDIDMILHFSTQALGLAPGDTEATLTGQTTGGISFTGTGSVTIVPAKVKLTPAHSGKANAPGQIKEPGSPAKGKAIGKDNAPGQNK